MYTIINQSQVFTKYSLQNLFEKCDKSIELLVTCSTVMVTDLLSNHCSQKAEPLLHPVPFKMLIYFDGNYLLDVFHAFVDMLF